MYDTLAYEARDGVALVRLDRPEKLNAINARMVAELRAVINAVRGDEGVRALVITGSGRAFSAGADIAELARLAGPPEFLHFLNTAKHLVAFGRISFRKERKIVWHPAGRERNSHASLR